MKKFLVIVTLIVLPLVLIAADGQLGKTIYQYDPRFVVGQLDRMTKVVLDSAKGVVYVAKRDQRGLSGGRIYDLNKIFEEFGKDQKNPLISPLTEFDDYLVHGRYKVDLGETEGGDLTFYDSANGRLWLCRYKTGSLDNWRCYSVANLVEQKTSETEKK